MRHHISRARCTLIAVLLVLPILLCGCWDRRETPTLAVVTGVGVDWLESGQYKITAQIMVPKANGGSGGGGAGESGKQSMLTESTGSMPREAFGKTGLELSRVPFLAHAKATVFGRALAEHGLSATLDAILRLPEPRETIWLAVSARTATEIMATDVALSQSTSLGLDALFGEQRISGLAPYVQLMDFFEMLLSDSQAAFAPLIDVVNGDGGKPTVRITGTAVFSGDKLAGTLSDAESRGLLWARGIGGGTALTVKDAQGGPLAALFVPLSRTRVTPYFDGLSPAVGIAILAEANVEELLQPGSLNDRAFTGKLTAGAEAAIENLVKATVSATQRLKTDVFGFGEAFHRSFRRQWRDMAADWPDRFSTMKVDVHAQVRIRRAGLTTKYPESGR